MEIDLSPQLAKKVYESNGGSYFTWLPSELPMLRQANIGAAKLSLQNNGFSLPHYSDSSKLAFVLQGIGRVGIVLPESEEKVVQIKKGDALALPFGTVTWWYNKEETELIVLFLGDTSKSHEPAEFTDFFLTGSNGIFTGFSTKFVGRAWNLEENDVKILVGKQSGKGIVKLEGNITLPNPKPEHRNGMTFKCEEAPLDDVDTEGGRVVDFNTKNLPLLGEVGLGADIALLEGRTMCCPVFSRDSALQIAYIVRGSGRVQIVGVDGRKVLKTNVKAGHLFIVPRFFVVSMIADPDQLECLSIYTTPNPICTQLGGSSLVWKVLSPTVLQAAFNVSGVEQVFHWKDLDKSREDVPPKTSGSQLSPIQELMILTVSIKESIQLKLEHDPTLEAFYLSRNEVMDLCSDDEMLTLSVVQFWLVYLHRQCTLKGNSHLYGFIDPQHILNPANCSTRIDTFIQERLHKGNKEFYLAPYLDSQDKRKQSNQDHQLTKAEEDLV